MWRHKHLEIINPPYPERLGILENPGTPSGMNKKWRWLSRLREGGWLIRDWIRGRLYDAGRGCKDLAKGAMRHFWKITNRAIVACAGKLFWESFGKVLGKFWEKFVEVDHCWS